MAPGTPRSVGAAGGPDVPADSTTERSGITTGLTATAILGAKAKGMFIDRPRALFAFPHARAQGKTATWAAELLSARLTNDVVPITGGTVRLGGRTLTTNAWKHSYQLSNGAGLALLGVSMLYGFPNLVEGWQDGGGPEGLLETRQGRTGVLATVGNVVGLGVMAAAFARAPAGPGRLSAMLRDPLHSATPMVLTRLGVGVPVVFNELGYLDFLNSGSPAGAWDTARDATTRHVDTMRAALPGD